GLLSFWSLSAYWISLVTQVELMVFGLRTTITMSESAMACSITGSKASPAVNSRASTQASRLFRLNCSCNLSTKGLSGVACEIKILIGFSSAYALPSNIDILTSEHTGDFDLSFPVSL